MSLVCGCKVKKRTHTYWWWLWWCGNADDVGEIWLHRGERKEKKKEWVVCVCAFGGSWSEATPFETTTQGLVKKGEAGEEEEREGMRVLEEIE